MCPTKQSALDLYYPLGEPRIAYIYAYIRPGLWRACKQAQCCSVAKSKELILLLLLGLHLNRIGSVVLLKYLAYSFNAVLPPNLCLPLYTSDHIPNNTHASRHVTIILLFMYFIEWKHKVHTCKEQIFWNR